MATGIYIGLLFIAGSNMKGSTIRAGYPAFLAVAFDLACIAALIRYVLN